MSIQHHQEAEIAQRTTTSRTSRRYFYIGMAIFLILMVILGFGRDPAGNGVATSGPVDILDSGGTPIPEQQNFDVTFYDINLCVEPDRKWIGGHSRMTATATNDLDRVVLHLDTLLTVNQVKVGEAEVQKSNWDHSGGLLTVDLQETIDEKEIFSVRVDYAGNPRHVKKADELMFGDGFYFEQTSEGEPWVSLVTVFAGADIWFPVKDHPSDEADSMAINITAPEHLDVASNGKLQSVTEHSDSTRTHHWFVSTPINNYGATINIAPYALIETQHESITGETFPYQFWVLEENRKAAKEYFPALQESMKYLEELLGPFPFRNDKGGAAQTYYHAMENQTIIAHNTGFQKNKWGGPNSLDLHEFAHEWLANMVTVDNWKHVWIHESIVSYITALYVEDQSGIKGYRKAMRGVMKSVKNNKPIVQEGNHLTIREALTIDYPIENFSEDFHTDIYNKGPAILHTLRFLIGRDLLIRSLQLLAYPDPKLKQVTDGSQHRFTDTKEYIGIVEELYGKELDWFFDAYLYYAAPPKLQIEESGNSVGLQWETASEYSFILPVPISADGTYKIVEMEGGNGSFEFASDYEIDPHNEILRY